MLHAAPLSHGVGPLRAAASRAGAHQSSCRALRAGEILDAARAPSARLVLRRADHADAARRISRRRCARRLAQPEDDHLRRRADVCRRPASARSALFGPRLYQLYGQGEVADDDHRPDAARMHADTAHPRCARAARLVRRARAPASRSGRRRRRPRAAARRDRRGRHAQRLRDGGLLAATRRPTPRRCAAAGCTPATSAASTRTAS